MTEAEAKQFWEEFQALKRKWNCDIYQTIDDSILAEFPDRSKIRLDDDNLSIGDLKNPLVPLPSATTVKSEFRAAIENGIQVIVCRLWFFSEDKERVEKAYELRIAPRGDFTHVYAALAEACRKGLQLIRRGGGVFDGASR